MTIINSTITAQPLQIFATSQGFPAGTHRIISGSNGKRIALTTVSLQSDNSPVSIVDSAGKPFPVPSSKSFGFSGIHQCEPGADLLAVLTDDSFISAYFVGTFDFGDLNDLAVAKATASANLQAAYQAAQYVQVLIDSHVFVVPIMGTTYNTDIVKLVNDAQLIGQAALVFPDATGQLRTIENIPAAQWLDFYRAANLVSSSNFKIKSQALFAIQTASTIEQVNSISLNVFPTISQINIAI